MTKDFINFYKDNKKVGYIEFKNISKDIGEIYIYGQILSGSEKYEEDDVTVTDFRQKLEDLGNVKEINIFQNSPGGSIMAGVNILNLLNRHSAIKNVYIDSLSASISSVITMCYDNLYIYPTSTLMIHEAMMGFFLVMLNKTQLKEKAEQLERIEENMIIPAYMQKATSELTEDLLRNLLMEESWLGAKDIQKYFKNVTLIEKEKDLAACANFDILNKYNNVPQKFKDILNNPINHKQLQHQQSNNLQKQKLKLELDLI
ncbi:head maturation protease, ClpP-related [Schnuerera sp.]|uniref:head maturation protease, ClpP-related n=1 Tax=Schnuerera sp. TaxID=2794844 RepID=UPI002BA6D030|nr:head maturation protease, ClpP-related [Schnuerera sp.]HSH36199.1 head maturation protease, ClpP-related [Schnuerera sp.]